MKLYKVYLNSWADPVEVKADFYSVDKGTLEFFSRETGDRIALFGSKLWSYIEAYVPGVQPELVVLEETVENK